MQSDFEICFLLSRADFLQEFHSFPLHSDSCRSGNVRLMLDVSDCVKIQIAYRRR